MGRIYGRCCLSRIEGTQASLSNILEYEASPKRKRKNYDDIKEVLNYREALLYAIDELDSRPSCVNLIRDIHTILLKGVRGQNKAKGEFRKIQNWIGPPNSTLETASYVPPSSDILMGSLLNWEKYFLQAIICRVELNAKRAKQIVQLYDEMKSII